LIFKSQKLTQEKRVWCVTRVKKSKKGESNTTSNQQFQFMSPSDSDNSSLKKASRKKKKLEVPNKVETGIVGRDCAEPPAVKLKCPCLRDHS
jgi:hypothetical protein